MIPPPQIRQRTRSSRVVDTAAAPPAGVPEALPVTETGQVAVTSQPLVSGAPVSAVQPATRPADDYDVGYGKPPRGRPFEPGRSGNPKGRPKGAKNDRTLIDEALNERVLVRENGREAMMPKRQVGARRFANKVAEGDPKAFAMWFKLYGIGFGEADRSAATAPSDKPPSYGSGALDELMALARRGSADDVGDPR